MSSRGTKINWERTAKRLNDYFRKLIPEDNKDKLNYAILVEEMIHKNRTKFTPLPDKAPIPIRYLREGDIFIKYPIEVYDLENGKVLVATNTPRDPKNIKNEFKEGEDPYTLAVECKETGYGLYIPEYILSKYAFSVK